MNQPTLKITIIGAGFSGTLVTHHLISQSRVRVDVTLLEKSPALARGLAYGTEDENHLLNVPAAKMSAFPDRPDDFLNWLKSKGLPYADGDFVPRQIYGRYLQNIHEKSLAAAKNGNSLHTERDVATKISRASDAKFAVTGASGKTYAADHCILALGNFPPSFFSEAFPLLAADARYLTQFWQHPQWAKIPLDAHIAVIGTGLSMVDAVASLRARKHRGPITAISRHGLLPRAHGPKSATYTLPDSLRARLKTSATVTTACREIRAEIARIETMGCSWRDVIDGLRPLTNDLWQIWSRQEKLRFIRHARPFWEVHRHRLAPSIAKMLEETTGQLDVVSGRISAITAAGEGQLSIRFTSRDHSREETFAADYLLDCSGTESNFRKLRDPLISSLLTENLAQIDPLGMGLTALQVDAIGPLRKGDLWETTAVPELREQAFQLAQSILARATTV